MLLWVMKISQYVLHTASLGKHCFTLAEVHETVGGTKAAVLAALHRLMKKKSVCSPARGFYLIVPPEYQSLGCLPPEQFLPDLMRFIQLNYYACLLSAAQYYGAVHQQPQVFQVMCEKNRRPVVCGRVILQFIEKATLSETPITTFNTPKGVLRVSTPEATALDLVMYAHAGGGLSHVATVLEELVEKLDVEKLSALVTTSEAVRAVQRLGYLLDYLEVGDFCEALWLATHQRFQRYVPLTSKVSTEEVFKNKRWKVIVNCDIESDL